MTARLRVLPIRNGERGAHYLVLDRVVGHFTTDDAEQIERLSVRLAEHHGHLLIFAFEVDLPGDESSADESAATPITVALSVDMTRADVGRQIGNAMREYERISDRHAR